MRSGRVLSSRRRLGSAIPFYLPRTPPGTLVSPLASRLSGRAWHFRAACCREVLQPTAQDDRAGQRDAPGKVMDKLDQRLRARPSKISYARHVATDCILRSRPTSSFAQLRPGAFLPPRLLSARSSQSPSAAFGKSVSGRAYGV